MGWSLNWHKNTEKDVIIELPTSGRDFLLEEFDTGTQGPRKHMALPGQGGKSETIGNHLSWQRQTMSGEEYNKKQLTEIILNLIS